MILALAGSVSSCSKSKEADARSGNVPEVEVFPITNSKLTNCRFTTSSPSYTFNNKIAPNVIRCDEGVPKRVEILTPNPLPAGLELDANQLALVGTAKEKVSQANYVVYLENEAGYVKIPLKITVQ